MELTAEQKQEVIASLKKHYADSNEFIKEQEAKGAYVNMPEWLKELKRANEKTKDLYERLESGEEIELGNGFNGDWIWGIFALMAMFSGKKDGA